MKNAFFAAISVCVCLLLTPKAKGHKVNVFAYAEGESVYTESFFPDGNPCKAASIEARGADGAVIAKGTTDDEGRFAFSVAAGQELMIVLDAGLGHRSEIKFLVPETANSRPADPASSLDRESQEHTEPDSGPWPSEACEELVRRELKPIKESLHRLERLQERPGIPEIVGGIGAIVGMAGAYLWGASRRSAPRETDEG